MKKNELVHFHALLVNVARNFVERGLLDREELEPYERLEVTPMALRESRAAHEEAVLTLARIIAESAAATLPDDRPTTGAGTEQAATSE